MPGPQVLPGVCGGMDQASSGFRLHRKTVAGRGPEQRGMQMPKMEDGSFLATVGAKSQDAAARGCGVLRRQRLVYPSDAQVTQAWCLMEPSRFPPPERTVPASRLWRGFRNEAYPVLVGMGQSPSGGTRGRGRRGQDRRDRDQPSMGRGSRRAGGWHPLPLPTVGVWTSGPRSRPGEGIHRPRMGWFWVQSRDLQQKAPREGAEGLAGPSIWSQGPHSGQPGLSCPAGMGSSPG